MSKLVDLISNLAKAETRLLRAERTAENHVFKSAAHDRRVARAKDRAYDVRDEAWEALVAYSKTLRDIYPNPFDWQFLEMLREESKKEVVSDVHD